MNTTIRGHNLRVTVMALLAVLLVLAVALGFARQPAPTTNDRNASPAIHAMSTDGNGESSISRNAVSSATPKRSNAWVMAAFGEG